MALSDMKMREQQLNEQNSDYFSLISVDAVSADQTSALQNNPYAHGLVLVVTLANEVNTAGYTPVLRTRDAAGNAVAIWTAAAELVAAGTYVYYIYLGAASMPAAIKEAVSLVIPRQWDLLMDFTTGAAGTDKFDIDVSAAYLK